jgi:yeast amino acid transporter
MLFYVGGVTIIGLLVPYNSAELLENSGSGNASASPFVIAIKNAGIKGLPSVINAVILISAFSGESRPSVSFERDRQKAEYFVLAGNSDLYASSRMLYGLACDHKAPALFRYCTKKGLPLFALIATIAVSPLAYLNVSTSGATVFNWFYNLSAVTGLLTWWTICLTYIRFYQGLKYHGIDRNTLPYKAPFQPYASYISAFMLTLIIIFNDFSVFLKGECESFPRMNVKGRLTRWFFFWTKRESFEFHCCLHNYSDLLHRLWWMEDCQKDEICFFSRNGFRNW